MKYLIILSVCSLFLNSCIRKRCVINGRYEFEIPATLSPAKDTFQIGDTITIVSSFDDLVYERKTDKSYKLENFRFYPELAVTEISDTVTNNSALSDFEVIVDTVFDFHQMVYSNGWIDYIGEYNYDGGSYSLEYQLIPKASGFYCFFHSSAIVSLGDTQDFEGKCRGIKEDVAVKLNNGADNNIEMLHDSPDPHYNDWILLKPDQRFHKGAGYVFYVKE